MTPPLSLSEPLSLPLSPSDPLFPSSGLVPPLLPQGSSAHTGLSANTFLILIDPYFPDSCHNRLFVYVSQALKTRKRLFFLRIGRDNPAPVWLASSAKFQL